MPRLPRDKHLTDSFINGKHRQLVKVMDSVMTDALLEGGNSFINSLVITALQVPGVSDPGASPVHSEAT